MSERQYVMFSYQWDHQVIVKNIRYRLWQEGYRVWIDIDAKDGMKNFIYSDMPNAVKDARVVIGCLSKAYEKSDNCKREGNCIGDYKKECIPLIVEKGYTRNDWVQGIFAGQLYINFSNIECFEAKFQELLVRLQNFYPELDPQKTNLIPPHLPPPESLSSLGNPDPPSTSSDTPPSSPPQEADRTDYARPLSGTDLSVPDFNNLLTRVSNWCDKQGRGKYLNKMKMVISEFKSKITLVDIQSMTRTHGLISLLVTSGIIKQTNIQVLIEVMKLCGMGGVESVIKPEWNLPKFEEVPITTFSDHRRKLLQFGNTVSDDNMRTIGQLYGIEGETDPYSLILQLETEGYITEGGTMNEFIVKLKDYKMVNEINALTSLND